MDQAKGMTLVLDMKLHCLQRVTGSPILSCDDLNGQKLRHCDSIYFEKFVEEHDGAVEGGKRPIKTLMFIEGCPTRLGCTDTHSLPCVPAVVWCQALLIFTTIICHDMNLRL
ncbi:hypothetical protein RJT34_20003 [Clitoria ternatea]|uniref:Uncharacterized protein n=1 Tax=Clitoria ternatea TaxID=43366 RepID=A0AAN9IS79_CLITE